MFSPNTVSQSLLDAVNNVMSEEKKDIDVTKSQVKKIAKTEVDKAEKAEKDENCECAVKEEVESIDEAGLVDTIKKVAKAGAGVAVKAAKALGGPDDEGHRKDLQKKMGAKPEQQHGKKSMAKYNEGAEFSFKARLLERAMTKGEGEEREEIVKGMKKNTEYFKKKYGERWKEVMNATATKKAMGEEVDHEDAEQLEEHTTDTLSGREEGGVSNDFKSFKTRLKGDGTEKTAPNKTIPSNANQESIRANGGAIPSPKIGVVEEVDEDAALLEEIIDYMQTEEYEQLDELSKGTLASYVRKASVRASDSAMSAGKHKERANAADDASYNMRKSNPKKAELRTSMKHHNDATNRYVAKGSKRLDGIEKAASRLAKEDVQLGEGKDPNMDAGCGAAPDFATSGSTSSNPVVARVKGITSSAMTKVKSNILANKSGK